MDRPVSPGQVSPAESIFAAWLAQRDEDFDALIRGNKQHERELNELHVFWMRIEPLLRLAGVDDGPASFTERVQAAHDEVDPAVSLGEPGAKPTSDLVRRLGTKRAPGSRYTLEGEIARGGMGAVLRVWDEDIRRHLAMKVVLGKGDATASHGPPPGDSRQIARFLEEAQVTGQLDHPGIVPVHELGVDSTGRLFFTMKLVKGRDLRAIYELVFAGREGWNETRALSVLLKVCEAVAYAHKKGVIHRDLKPANVMVGDFGEVYVMDWGLARVVGRKDAHDLRLRLEPGPSTVSVQTQRREEKETSPDSPLVTMDGDIMGTPCYMSPEQARGELDKLGPRSDVYSVGAMLYHLLTGHLPYVPPGTRATNLIVLALVQRGAPEPVHALNRGVPAELEAICDRAMARDPDRRYADTLAMAEDLRAYLEHRVVKAYETGAIAEFGKWVERNKGLARASAAGLLIALGGLGWVSIVQTQAKHDIGIARDRAVDSEQRKDMALREARALALANASKAAESVDPMRALLLAREAARVEEMAHVELSPAVVSQLHSALVGSLEVAVFREHTGRLASAVFSPSGDSVLTASGDHTARIRKVKADGSGCVALVGHERSLYAAVFSPAGDRILTGSEDGTARLWDLEGKEIRRLEGHTDAVNVVAYSPSGDRILTGSFDGTARLWDADGSPLAVLTGHTGRLTNVAWSVRGDRIVTASEDGDVRVWDARGAPVAVLPHRSSVWAVAFSPSGQRILTGADDGVSRLWAEDGVSRQWEFATVQPSETERERTEVTSVAFSPDGNHFAAGKGNGTVLLWNSQGVLVAELRGHTSAVWCTTFSPDSKMLATAGSWDQTARVWDLQGRSVAVFRGHAGYVRGVQFDPNFPDRSQLLTASGDGTARTWRLKGAEIATYRSVPWGVRAFSVCACGKGQVLVVPPVGPARLLNQDGKTVHEYGEATESLRTAKFCRDGSKRVLTADQSGWVRVFAFKGGAKPVVSFHAHDAGSGCLADFSPDGSRILTWSDDATAKLWDLAGNWKQTFDEHEDRVRSAAFSPKGDRIVTGSWDCRARIWDVGTGNPPKVLSGHRHTVVSAVFSHLGDGDKVLTAGGVDQTARIWNREGHELHQLLHASSADIAAFSPDDTLVAVGCGDGSTWLWETDTGRLLAQLPGHSAGVIAAEFEPEGGRLATACADGNIRVRCTAAADVLEIVKAKIASSSGEFTHAEIKQYAALLGPESDALLSAYEYVELKLESSVVVADVVANVRTDASLGEDVRMAALRVLARTHDDPEQVREKTWEVVRQPGRPPDDYVNALRWAMIADDLGHAMLSIRVLMGVAQHRVGNEAAALQTLEEVDPKLGETSSGTRLACIAALALVHHAMGHDDKSRVELARLDRLSSALTEPVPFRYRVFLDEARALEREIGSGNGPR